MKCPHPWQVALEADDSIRVNPGLDPDDHDLIEEAKSRLWRAGAARGARPARHCRKRPHHAVRGARGSADA